VNLPEYVNESVIARFRSDCRSLDPRLAGVCNTPMSFELMRRKTSGDRGCEARLSCGACSKSADKKAMLVQGARRIRV
jgi:hypothetical protein